MEVFSAGAGPPSVGRGGRRGAGGLRQLPFPFKTGWFPSFLGGIRGWNSENRWKTREADRSRSGRRWGVLIAGGGGALF